MKRKIQSFRLHIVGLILLLGGCLAWASAAGKSNSLWAAAEELASNYGGVVVQGDANCDGSVDIVDVTTIVDYILEKQIPNDQQKANADVNNDQVIDVVDLTATVQIILGTYKPAGS